MKDWRDKAVHPEAVPPETDATVDEPHCAPDTGSEYASARADVSGHDVSGHLADYLALPGSTTYFLEQRAGRRIGVEVLQQRTEHEPSRGAVLHRRSRLYLDAPDNALLIADAEVLLDRLAPMQRARALDGSEGLGRLLDPDNRGRLHKRDLEIVWLPAPILLRVGAGWAVARRFDLLMEGEPCARIREILSRESLARLG